MYHAVNKDGKGWSVRKDPDTGGQSARKRAGR